MWLGLGWMPFLDFGFVWGEKTRLDVGEFDPVVRRSLFTEVSHHSPLLLSGLEVAPSAAFLHHFSCRLRIVFCASLASHPSTT